MKHKASHIVAAILAMNSIGGHALAGDTSLTDAVFGSRPGAIGESTINGLVQEAPRAAAPPPAPQAPAKPTPRPASLGDTGSALSAALPLRANGPSSMTAPVKSLLQEPPPPPAPKAATKRPETPPPSTEPPKAKTSPAPPKVAAPAPAAQPQAAPTHDAKACPDTKLSQDEVRALILRIALEEQFDEKLAQAVARAESDFGRAMVSSKGAVGIMQLMESTAPTVGVSDRCDPEQNIRSGIRYLKALLGEFDNPILALAAYNAGPGRVYEHRGIPVWNETAKYVVKVLNYWQDFDGQLARRGGRASASQPLPSIREPAVQLRPEAPPPAGERWIDGHVIKVN